MLLGINRNEVLIKKKIIEIAEIDETLRFGKEVFNIPNQIGLKRKIYGYSVDSDMSLLFDEKDEEIIVMDHLFPSKPMYEGKAEYYVPDFSFDALRYKKGIWTYEEDYDARMPKNLKDRYYDMELPDQNKIY